MVVVNDVSSATAVAGGVAIVDGRGSSSGMDVDDDDRRWSSGMETKWVWSEPVM
jgi:hypothetical protein